MSVPEKLGKYLIRRQLGAGAMGVVYEGFDPLIERSVAIKVIRREAFDGTRPGELRQRLRREAQAAGRLSHPGIVGVYEYGEDADTAFIAMELVRGSELKAALDAGRRFTPTEAAHLIGQVLAALQHAHDRGVVHRDVKPGNIFVQEDGSAKVADFGIARLERSDLTQTGAVIGTPSYMSPEQLQGLAVDGRSDLFACGVVLYELLTGCKPFTGSVTTVIHKVLNEEPRPPSEVDRNLTPAWDAVLRRALAKKPDDRYASATEFGAAVARAAAALPDPDATVVQPRPQPKPSPERSPGWAVATVLGAVAVGGAALAWWLTRAPRSPAALPVSRPASAVVVATTAASAPVSPASLPSSAPTAASAPPAVPPRAMAARPLPPAPAPAASRAVDVRRPTAAPAPPVVAMPPVAAPAPADPWARQRERVGNARGELSFAAAVGLLLDVEDAPGRQLLADYDRLLATMPAHSAIAVGVRDGYLRHRWQFRAPDAATAARQALTRCGEVVGQPCTLVQVDREFRKNGFLAAVRPLGAVDVAAARHAMLRGIASGLPEWRQQLAGAPAAAPASAPVSRPPPASPAAPSVAPTPSTASDWSAAWTRLAAKPGPRTLAQGLVALLDVRAAGDLEQIAAFEAAVRRLRWNSALALGSRGGMISVGHAQGDSKLEWAEERALAACQRTAGPSCKIVFANGEYRANDFAMLAAQFGSRPQAQVRQAFLESTRRSLEKGL